MTCARSATKRVTRAGSATNAGGHGKLRNRNAKHMSITAFRALWTDARRKLSCRGAGIARPVGYCIGNPNIARATLVVMQDHSVNDKRGLIYFSWTGAKA